LSGTFFLYVKRNVIVTKKDVEFIEFTIDMYIKYAEKLEINSKKEHDKICLELERIKKNININNNGSQQSSTNN
jgi:hypothetical protein